MIFKNDIAAKVAEYLLEIKAIQLSPDNLFTWSSGIESPIYCDNRKSLSYPVLRNLIKQAFLDLIQEKFPEATGISGVATAGIAHGALLADVAEMPFNYVRSKPKGHGMQNLIEGELLPGSKLIVVEDLISTGGSSLKAVEALKEAGAEVLCVVAIFDYGFSKAKDAFEAANCPYYTLSDFENLVNYAESAALFPAEQLQFMRNWNKAMA